jgi:hypothetical protein
MLFSPPKTVEEEDDFPVPFLAFLSFKCAESNFRFGKAFDGKRR